MGCRTGFTHMGKRLGQHFLHSPHVLDEIARAAAVAEGEPVLEVGPGHGVLTGRLLDAGARVTAVELDPLLAGELAARWDEHPRFRLIQGDVLREDLDPVRLFGTGEPYAVIANLPYYLSTPLLFRLMALRRWHSRMVLMVQREVGERLLALPPDGKTYGSLSVVGHHAYAMRMVTIVPPGAFRPPPKVHSAVVAFTPRPAALPEADEVAFLSYVKGLFSARRKRLAGTLTRRRPPWPPERLAAALAIVGERRPEALSPEEHLSVYTLLTRGS
jgi:16S rRNA (adenine1518-N6/adenine1519-N6)-dimethyltransferase